MATTIYILNTCNAWKEWSSMSTYFIGTSQSKLLSAVRNGIRNGDFYYGSNEDTPSEQLARLREDLKEFNRIAYFNPSFSIIHEVSTRLEEAYIESYTNNSYA